MNKGLGVKVIYRNEKLEPVKEAACPLEDYLASMRVDILRVITDVEDALYAATGNAPKHAWNDKTWEAFCRIKHKLLDKAGEIGRLQDNLFEYEAGEGAYGKDRMGPAG